MRQQAGYRVGFASGTTALFATLRALEIRRSLVAVPPNVCPNVIVAILASSNRPLFVDIEPERLGLSPECLDSAIGQAAAVIAVHAYGIPCRVEEIARRCASRGIPLIEDCAQAEGASFAGRQVGGFGDVAIFSYGAGKILSLAGGGGTAVAGRRAVADCLKQVRERLPAAASTDAAEVLSRCFRDLYNECYPDRLAKRRARASRLFGSIGRSMFARPRPGLDREIESARSGLGEEIGTRRRKSEIYRRELAGEPGVRLCVFPEGSVPWRYNLQLEHPVRQHALKALLSEGVKVSSWYPDIRRFLVKSSYEGGPTPRAVELDETILNLWLDGRTDEDAIVGTAQRVKELVRDFCRSVGRNPAAARAG